MKRRPPPKNAPHLLRTRRQVISALALGLGPASCLGNDRSDPNGSGGSGTGGSGIGGSGTGGSGLGGAGNGGAGIGGTGTGGAVSSGGPGSGGASSGGVGTGGVPSVDGLLQGRLGRTIADQVALGTTGIQVSRLAMGTGTHGSNGESDQTRLGMSFPKMLAESYSRGITFWETADQYGAHDEVALALEQVGRKNIVLLTKSHAQTYEEMDADLMRFLAELGTDFVDVLLLHNKQSSSWVGECSGAMEYLEEAKKKGIIRAHGVSCHTLDALKLAADSPWVEVDFARINPFGLHMDAEPKTVIPILERMKLAGKGVFGMKILGQGDAVNRFDQAIEHATRLDALTGFTIGFTDPKQIDQVAAKVASI
jgi:1-deoxyxylulose-5-phosphate synthase